MGNKDLQFVGLGAAFWASGVVSLGGTGATLCLDHNKPLVVGLYALVLPINALVTHEVTAAVTRTDPTCAEMFRGMVVGATTALLIDGVAIHFFPEYTYNLAPPGMAFTGATILYAAGCVLAYSLWRCGASIDKPK